MDYHGAMDSVSGDRIIFRKHPVSFPVTVPLDGGENRLVILFSAFGSYQRGGYAPWPLFECAWNDGRFACAIRHNVTNQIKAPVGQINLDTTPFRAVNAWRQYRITLERAGQASANGPADGFTITVEIDGTQIWAAPFSAAPLPANERGKPSFTFTHRAPDGKAHAVFGYLMLVRGGDAGLPELPSGVGIDPADFPPVPDGLLSFEPLPPVPEGPTWPGDTHPLAVFADGTTGLDPDSLPFSRNAVRKVSRGTAGSARAAGSAGAGRIAADFIVDPRRANGRTVFATIPEAIAAAATAKDASKPQPPAVQFEPQAPASQGAGITILIKRGVYTGALALSGIDLTLVGEDPFTTIIVGYEAYGNGIAKNTLVHYDGAGHSRQYGTFRAENLTFWNKGAEWNASIGHDERRGAALCAENIRDGRFTNCIFLGQQDTLYLRNGFLRFDRCYVEGDIDFICGGATAIFDDCHLHSLEYKGGYIAAAAPVNDGKTPLRYGTPEEPPDGSECPEPRGFVFRRCLITMDPAQKEPLHLGRGPWVNGSGLPDRLKNATPSAIAYEECEFGTETRPFFLDRENPWCGMDRPHGREFYRESGNSFHYA